MSAVGQRETIWGLLQRADAIQSDAGTSAKEVVQFLKDNGGFDRILAMVDTPNKPTSCGDRAIRMAVRNSAGTIERIPIEGNGIKLQGVIVYPEGYDPKNKSVCIVYNNPNGVTISDLLDTNSPVYQLLAKNNCPIILYDYRGTGISETVTPTPNTLSLDGITVLNYAMDTFEKVDVWGTSLGGAVATVACDACIRERINQADRVRLFNHDSFTRTYNVAREHFHEMKFNPEDSMRSLANWGVKIVILAHQEDPAIISPRRMIGIASDLGDSVSTIECSRCGHANLSQDMLDQLV